MRKQEKRSGLMQKRTIRVAILAVLALILILSVTSVAAAQTSQWPDLTGSVVGPYGVTVDQVSAISDGFGNGLWMPYQNITRAQFVKLADAALKIDYATPATASFTDVPTTNYYYKFIEGAKAAGMIQGVTATTFAPNANITRQQAVTILARYIAKVNGDNLDTIYTAAQVTAILAHFSDAATISPDMKNAIAFAFAMGITDGNDQVGTFSPNALLTRIQAAALIIRCEALNAIAPHGVPAHITLVSTDKSEYLIGQPHTVTFNVTDMNNHPVAGALVNFDSIWAQEFYVGNITSARGVLTDAFGNATVNIVATEPGTQRLSANVGTLAAVYTTDYWLALDDVYTVAANDGTPRPCLRLTTTPVPRIPGPSVSL
jgi:hypothetical protein